MLEKNANYKVIRNTTNEIKVCQFQARTIATLPVLAYDVITEMTRPTTNATKLSNSKTISHTTKVTKVCQFQDISHTANVTKLFQFQDHPHLQCYKKTCPFQDDSPHN